MGSSLQPETLLTPTCFTLEQAPAGVLLQPAGESNPATQAPVAAGAPALQNAGGDTAKAPAKVKTAKKGFWNRSLTMASRLLMALAAGFTGLILVLAVGPRFLPYQVCSVLSGSMEPTLPVGSIVILAKTEGSQLNVGDIITFSYPNHPNQLVTHRIYQVKQGTAGPGFVTKGDANNAPDNWVVNGSGTGWREMLNIPYLGYILGALGSPLLRLLILGIPACFLGILLLVEIWSPKKRMVVGA
jgi:signal peptidase